MDLFKRQQPSALLGLVLDGSRVEAVVLRRTNGSLQLRQSFSAALSLDLLTNDAELVGRELRNHLEAAGVRDRHCVVGIPLKWALIVHAKMPELAAADAASYLQIEAERGFPCDVSTLMLATTQYASSNENHATLVGVPRNHLATLEQVLRAAQLKPVSLSLGICALQPPDAEASSGVMALVIGDSYVGLQVSCNGGVLALRSLEGAFDTEGGGRRINAELVARETRITLGQLPPEFRNSVRRLRIFGPPELARDLARELEPRYQPMGFKVELASVYASGEFGLQLPPGAVLSPAFSLAARQLAGRKPLFEFLPPKISNFQKLAARYSSGALQRAGIAAAALLLAVGGLFLFQQWQLVRSRSQWAELGPKVRELEGMQQKIRQFRPWFDESLRSLSILRQLTESFPEDGVVTAKTIEIRDQSLITLSGIARDNQALLKTMDRLRTAPAVANFKTDQIRGKSPMQFTFEFQWNEGRDK